MESLEKGKEPGIPELLFKYLELRSGERVSWTSREKLKGTVADYNKVQAAMDFLRNKGISTVENLDTRLDEISQTTVSFMGSMKKSEKRIKAIGVTYRYKIIGHYKVYRKCASKKFSGLKERNYKKLLR